VNNFNLATQPYYVLMHHDGKTLLNKPTNYDQGKDPKFYQSFLECGLDAFKLIQQQESGGGERIGLK
jgi:hypothetical protein